METIQATLKCKEAMRERAKVEAETQKLDEYIEQKTMCGFLPAAVA